MTMRTVTSRAMMSLAALTVTALAVTGCAADQSVEIGAPAQVEGDLPEETLAAMQTAVDDAVIASGASGALVGVWVPWSGSWVTGVGTTAHTSDTEVTTDMRFRAAEVTRAMTCDVLFSAADDGIVSLDDSITTYVSSVPDLAEVTLLDLCNSTSGVGAYRSTLESMWLKNPERVWNPRELASYGMGHEAVADPGDQYRSSDAGYVLLGIALERASGMSAAELYDRYVFDPLDLENTALPADQWATADEEGVSALPGYYSTKVDGEMNCTDPLDVTNVSLSTGFTDSGAVTTIDDLGRYLQALAAGALAGEAASERWDNPLAPSSSSSSWHRVTGGAYLAGSMVGQYGEVPGYSVAGFADPETGMTVAVVLNNSGGTWTNARDLTFALASIASKTPAADGQTAPEFGLPWTAETFTERIAGNAICEAPADDTES